MNQVLSGGYEEILFQFVNKTLPQKLDECACVCGFKFDVGGEHAM